MLRLLHLSDAHLTGSGDDEDGVSSTAALHGLLHDLRHLPPIDLVVHSPDVAVDGSVEGYDEARQQLGAFAADRGAGLVLVTGNHDVRGAFTDVLGSGHRSTAGGDVGATGPGCAAVSDHAGLRVIGLDTLVPGSTHGHLGAVQLEWLREQLRAPAPAGTVLALHHPPVWMKSHPLLETVVLDDPDALAAVIEGSDVRLILCGHLHHQLAAHFAGVPIWVTPGVVTRTDLTAPSHLVRAVLGAGASVHELDDMGGVTSYVLAARDPGAGAEVYLIDPISGQDADEA